MWAHSSGGERLLHTQEVPGSNPGEPIEFAGIGPFGCDSLVTCPEGLSFFVATEI